MAIQINQKKYNRQFEGAKKWRDNKGKGTFWWETGVGKTFAACDIITKMLTAFPAYQVIIVAPSPEIQKQWIASIKSFIPQQFHSNVEVITSHKVIEDCKEGKFYYTTLLIVDELHEFYTNERIKILDGTYIKYKFNLGLTANYEDMAQRYKLIEHIFPVIDRIDSEEAIREGYISKYIEYNVGVYLTDIEAEKYKELSSIISKNLSKFGGDGLKIASRVLSDIVQKDYKLVYAIAAHNGWKQNLSMLDPKQAEISELWSPGKIIGYARTAMDSIRERKNLLYRCVNKLKVAIQVVTKFDDLKTICFSQSTLYADTLAAHINNYYTELDPHSKKVCVVYHSQLNTIVETDPQTGKQKKKGKTVLKKEAIEAIRSGTARVISTASSLDRGFDVKDIRLALTTSGTQNPTQYNQRKGRAVRVEEEEEDIIVLIVNIYAINTMDEKWLKTRQSKSKNVVYWVDNVEDINYTPRRKESFNISEI